MPDFEKKNYDAEVQVVPTNASVLIDASGEVVPEKLLARDFKFRHVNLIAIAGAIGTGLIIGSGTALKRGGPASLFIAYTFCGSVLLSVLLSLAEMASFSPMDKAFSGYTTRYVDKALGFAAGWNYFFNFAITFPTELTAIGIVIHYWREDLNVAIFISVFYVVVMFTNWFNVRYYGEFESCLAIAKIIALLICYMACLVITCGGSPTHTTIGFQYWKEDAFCEYLIGGKKGKFLGFWACVIQSVFSYNGAEGVGVVFGECPDPKRNIPRAARQTFFRIGFLYIFGVFILGLACSPKNPLLAKSSANNASSSPFVIAFKTAEIKILPDFINGCLLIFVGSSANTNIYMGSRTLYGLARDGLAPRFLLKLNRYSVPYIGCLITGMFGLLAYMNASSSSSVIFGYFSDAVSVFGLLNWINILLAYIGYYKACVYQNVPREDIPFRMWFQPYSAYIALCCTIIMTFFNGYNAFIQTFEYKQFIVSYIGIVVYLAFILGYKFWHKTKMVTPATAVLYNYMEVVQPLSAKDENVLDKAAAKE